MIYLLNFLRLGFIHCKLRHKFVRRTRDLHRIYIRKKRKKREKEERKKVYASDAKTYGEYLETRHNFQGVHMMTGYIAHGDEYDRQWRRQQKRILLSMQLSMSSCKREEMYCNCIFSSSSFFSLSFNYLLLQQFLTPKTFMFFRYLFKRKKREKT